VRAVNRIWLFVLLAGTLAAQHGYTPGDVEDGQRVFVNSCAVCHGPDGNAVPGVDLGHDKFRRATTDDELIRIIQKGIPGTAMPPNNLDNFRAGTVVAYLHSMAVTATAGGSAIPGDAARGQAVFEGKGNCTSCHRVRGNGSRTGPDLTDIGSFRRAVQLQQSILDPDAEILPQNRFVHIATKDGRTFDARLLNQDAYTVQIFDSKEHMLTLQKSGLKEFTFATKSPMPSYKDKLTGQELADVVNYLASLKGIEAK